MEHTRVAFVVLREFPAFMYVQILTCREPAACFAEARFAESAGPAAIAAVAFGAVQELAASEGWLQLQAPLPVVRRQPKKFFLQDGFSYGTRYSRQPKTLFSGVEMCKTNSVFKKQRISAKFQ